MNKNLHFDVNKETKKISVKRSFSSNLNIVWDAWTNPSILDLWWAPKPYRTQTKSMDFREGGSWLYAMLDPQNQAHWCRADYQSIAPFKSYSALDAFCDEQGVINQEFPRSFWTNTFIEDGDSTTVHILIEYKELSDLERIIELGFKEGFTMAIGNLDQYLEEYGK